METFDSSWWIYYRDKMLFLFSSVQEKLYIFAKISHYLLFTIFKLIVRLSLFASSISADPLHFLHWVNDSVSDIECRLCGKGCEGDFS